MTGAKHPIADANRVSTVLKQVLGPDRFPVKVDEVAMEYSQQRFPKSPVAKVDGQDLAGFDGMLTANASRSKWLILYNSAVRSSGRKRFTIAHEFGHYMLHAEQQDHFECSDADIETGGDRRNIETEADLFASTLLMPLDDFRKQVASQPVSFDLLGHCADRYGVSLTAAALRWTEIAEKRTVLVASRDDHMLWAKSNNAAFKSGAYFPTRKSTIEVPRTSVAHSSNCVDTCQTETVKANVWFAREPATTPVTVMTMVSEHYEYTLTLLLMPDAEWRVPQYDEEEPLEDTFDRFIHNGQPLVR